MTKSTITRERLEQLADNNTICKVSWDDRIELAQIALAAMDSESGCLPLDYLQGHKDGLEWAAQLAEANHPETGDWLYDDPIELAKAIRKGPDMPPAQPAADSEPVAWTWHYREQWHVTSDKGRAEFVAKDGDVAVLPLYRHAQPVPVVSAELLHTAASAIEDLLTTKDRTGAGVWFDLPFRLRSAANAQPAPVVPEEKPIPNTLSMYAVDAVAAIAEVKGWNACRAAMLAAAPQSPGSEPATVPGKWIPLSEQMPPSRHEVLVGRWWGERPRWCCKWATYIPGHPDAQSSGWLIPGASWTPTHWMELPAAPQEVK
ncbi:TPA: DUF551 domain-containing protein [Klebsiella pneumoniae]|nr:DUF551 domain-containing protein [Klebsiella pneumoniae]